MRSGAGHGQERYFHEAAFYASDDELLAIVLPFLLGGVDAGQPTLVSMGEANAALVRGALGDVGGVTFLRRDDGASAVDTMLRYHNLLASLLDEGASQIRAVGEVPHPGLGASWEQWGRYEAAVNRIYDEFPVWGLCPYDLRITPSYVLDQVRRTHPFLTTAAGSHEPNPAYEDPGDFLRQRQSSFRDPLENREPDVDLENPTPAGARRAAHAVAGGIGLARGVVENLVLAISETVANALHYGRPPVRLRLWADDARVLVAVTDRGTGPQDPFVGMLPPTPSAPDGRGLWIVHQLCQHVTMTRDSEGFTVRLVAGGEHAAA